MKVIDEILNEWSFRCHDGIVDMNDPKKVSILKEILIEEGIDDDILDATLNLPKDDPSSEEKKQKALAVLTGISGNEKDKEIERLKQQIDGSKAEKQKKAIEIIEIRKKLVDHGLSIPYAYYVTSVFVSEDKEDDLINYFKNPPKLEIKDGNNIKNKPKELLKSDSIVDELYKQLAGSAKTKGVGKEEFFLVVFYDNVIKDPKEGDIDVDGEKYEVKGVGAMVTPSNIGRGSKKDVVTFLKVNFINNLNIDDTQKTEIENMFKKKERWTYTISNLYKTYPDKSDFFKNIKEALNKKYPGLNIDEQTLEDGKTLATTITKHLIKQSEIKDTILFISPEGIMNVYDIDTLLEAIDKEINIIGFSDFAPRLTFKDPENDISKQSDEPVELPKSKITQEIQNLILNLKFKKKLNKIVIKAPDVDNKIANKLQKKEFLKNSTLKLDNIDYYEVEDGYVDILKQNNLVENQDLTEELTNYLIKLFK